MDGTDCPKVLVEARRGGSTRGSYVEPTEAQLSAISRAMTALLSGKEAEARTEAGKAGFHVVEVPELSGVLAMVEKDKNGGGGAYLVRKGSTSKLVVQAPHTFFDAGTFPLACGFFRETNARALFINTVHRYKGAAENAGHDSDVAHLKTSLFLSATLGLLDALPAPSVVQLHGFDKGRDMKAVVSAGEDRPGAAHVAKVAKDLDAILGGGIARYPEDTRELGATTNVEGKAVRAKGGRFLHIEMSGTTRKLLLADAEKRSAAFAAIASFAKP